MNAIVVPSPQTPKPRGNHLGSLPALAANDEVLTAIAERYTPEPAMVIRFVGLNGDEQRRALASFPGARRCTLADN